MSKKAMVLKLNTVQIKPEESEGYYDYDLEPGHIRGTMCEFAINDKEHIEIIAGLKGQEGDGDGDSRKLDVWNKLNDLKDQIDDEEADAKKKAMGISNQDADDQFANVTTIFNQQSFEILPQEKVCIVGAEDDGKSMFLYSLLGETELLNGTMEMNGSMGYLSFKRAAFVKGTVRDNITLFGRFHKKLYNKACEVALLNTARMPGNDFMMVADSGANLFPKEKLQIVVARLIYQDADIF